MVERRTVLVVDDEEQLLRLMGRVVERGGMRVLTAATASEARRLFREHLHETDVVLLDVTMPDGEGAATLLPEFLAERPSLQVIITSGDAPPEDLERELVRIGAQFLRKPFAPKALLRLLEPPSEKPPGSRASHGPPALNGPPASSKSEARPKRPTADGPGGIR